MDLSHAPVPTNDSERLLFRQLYHNLVRIDCEGVVRPELAEAWTHDSASGSWRFTLRDTTLSPDGSRLVANQVLAAWRGRPRLLAAMGIDSVIAADARTLIIGIRDGGAREPRLFAQPALSIALSPGLSLASNGRFLKPSPAGPTVLEFVTAPGDLRDVLDSGTDLLVTHDGALSEYAASHRDLQTFPLPWSRTYVLVQPTGADSLPTTIGTDSVRGSLARDVVKADARPATVGWAPPPCGRSGAPERSSQPAPRLAYAAGDPVARGLAERIVALSGSDAELSIIPLADSALASSLRAGTNQGYILALSSNPEDFCSFGPPIPAHATIHTLIETRAHAIVRRGSPELTVDWDGTPRLAATAEQSAGP